MKICIISSSLYLPNLVTGLEAQARRIVQNLVLRGESVTVITTSPDATEEPQVSDKDGAKVYTFRPRGVYERSENYTKSLPERVIWHVRDLYNIGPGRTIKKLLRKDMPDVVHIHNYRGLSLSVFGVVRSLGLPLVFTAHDYSVICPRFSLLKSSGEICPGPLLPCRMINQIKKMFIDTKPDIVTAPSQFVLDKLQEKGMFRRVETIKLPNSNDALIKAGIERKPNGFNILYAGQLTAPKGVDLLINAFKQVKSSGINLNIAGQGPLSERLRQMAGDDTRIVFHGFVSNDVLTALYKEAHVTVVPSIWYEPFGLVIIESMQHGTPVIASNIGGIPDIIENGYNGLLFKAGDVGELRNAIEKLAKDREALEKLAENAIKSVEKYNIDVYIEKLREIYRNAIMRNNR